MRATYITIAFVSVVLSISPLTIAQHTPIAQHTQGEDLIDGSVHPELIPDTTAYRLFLATFSGTDETHRKLQAALFDKMKLPIEDRPSMTSMLDDFGVHFQKVLDDDTKEAVEHPATDHTNFVVQRDLMMDNMLHSLKVGLSPRGFKLLDAYVQYEKRNMRVSPELERRRR